MSAFETVEIAAFAIAVAQTRVGVSDTIDPKAGVTRPHVVTVIELAVKSSVTVSIYPFASTLTLLSTTFRARPS